MAALTGGIKIALQALWWFGVPRGAHMGGEVEGEAVLSAVAARWLSP